MSETAPVTALRAHAPVENVGQSSDSIIVDVGPESRTQAHQRQKISRAFYASYLVVLGAVVACFAVTFDIIIDLMYSFHLKLAQYTQFWLLNMFLWTLFVMLCCFGAYRIIQLKYKGRKLFIAAPGSGIPEMKTLLSGGYLPEYLATETLIGKIPALVLTVGSGMYVSKLGPFVHLSCLIGEQINRLPWFSQLRKNLPERTRMVAVACALGVTVSYGTPLGGILFSIEVTANYYPTSDYWYAFIAAATGGSLYRLLWHTYFDGMPYFTNLLGVDRICHALYLTGPEFVLIVLIGIATGLIGHGFIAFAAFISRTRKKFINQHFGHPLVYTLLVGFTHAFFDFPGLFGEFMANPPIKILKSLVDDNDTLLQQFGWNFFPLLASLAIYTVVKFFLLALVVSMPLPLGLYIPIVVLGAAIGRFAGTIFTQYIFPDSQIPSAGYALIGAACLAVAITHTLSSTLVVIELTGQITLLVPLLIGGTLAYFVSRWFTGGVSIYDRIAIDRKLPYIHQLKFKHRILTAGDVMRRQFAYVTPDMPLGQLGELLKGPTSAAKGAIVHPVVDSPAAMNLLGQINNKELAKYSMHCLTLLASPNVGGKPELGAVMAMLNGAKKPYLAQSSWDKPVVLEPMYLRGGRPRLPPLPYRPPECPVFDLHTPIQEVHMLFIMLQLQTGFVVHNGVLQGVITRDDVCNLDEKYREFMARTAPNMIVSNEDE